MDKLPWSVLNGVLTFYDTKFNNCLNVQIYYIIMHNDQFKMLCGRRESDSFI